MVSAVTLQEDLQLPLRAVAADGPRLERVLVNLISNAIDHTPRGGRVRIGATELGSEEAIEFSVHDTGSGIPREEQDRIFDKFHQVAGADQQRPDRSGLGLPFCKAVVDSHGGHIHVESDPGEGTRIRFTIPCAGQ